MRISLPIWRNVLFCAASLPALAACSGGGASHVGSTPVPAAQTAGTIDQAFALLMAGNQGEARKLLARVIKLDPQNANAHLLLDSIEHDPQAALGMRNYRYTVRPGDTPVELTQRFLGNRLLAYRFLRYNNLKAPVTLVAGQILLIPGEPPRPPALRPEPVAHDDERANAHGEERRERSEPVSARPRPSAPVAVACDLRAAQRARAAGLSALNQGNVGRAVALLGNAAALYPCNLQIPRDLARARRIAATVKAR